MPQLLCKILRGVRPALGPVKPWREGPIESTPRMCHERPSAVPDTSAQCRTAQGQHGGLPPLLWGGSIKEMPSP